jgi:hypothetical protein
MKLKIIFLSAAVLFVLIFQSCKNSSNEPDPDKSNINYVNSYNTPGYAYDVQIYQGGINFAFIADGTSGLQIINVTNVSAPFFVSSYNTQGTALNVKIANINNTMYAFVADGNKGYDIINVANPSQPALDTIISYTNDKVLCSYIDAQNKIAYVGTYYGYMYIYDISNLPAVSRIAVYSEPLDNINSIYVVNGIAYLAENSLGLEIVNVNNPSSPSGLSYFDSPGFAYDVKVSNNKAYLADGSGMIIIDVTNGFNPVALGSFSSIGAVYSGIFLSNSNVYTADGPRGTEVIGVGTPSAPVQLGFYHPANYSSRLYVIGSYIFVADGADGLVILQTTF